MLLNKLKSFLPKNDKESQPIKVIKTTEKRLVDDLILDQKGYIVATVDKELKQKLKKKKIQILTIKQKKYIILE